MPLKCSNVGSTGIPAHITAPLKVGRQVVTPCSRIRALQSSRLIDFNRCIRDKISVGCKASSDRSLEGHAGQFATASTLFWLLNQLPANAVESTTDFSKGSFSTESYVVTLGLFLISLPGQFFHTCLLILGLLTLLPQFLKLLTSSTNTSFSPLGASK